MMKTVVSFENDDKNYQTYKGATQPKLNSSNERLVHKNYGQQKNHFKNDQTIFLVYHFITHKQSNLT
jgi:hypothetical protein